MNIRDVLVRSSLSVVLEPLMSCAGLRRLVLGQVEKALYRETHQAGPMRSSYQAQQDRLDLACALLHGLDHAMSRRLISRHAIRTVLDAFLGNIFLNEESAILTDKLGFEPPSFITISPTGKCNLKCVGCYASDAALAGNQLDFETFDRILREKRELWGSHFTVISGGEPFLWKDHGFDLVELARRHPQDVFMVYTNGTTINARLVERLAEVGNISPAISVEGFAEETDARRGEGVYRNILAAMGYLKEYGIPFGISATATSRNWEVIVSDRFADFYFGDQCALYCWIFQYMPIGRSQSLDLVVPPEARVHMARRMWELVRSRKVFMVDFWNSGTASLGCISAGRGSGYFYINWDGDIMPCVFTPYAADNIHRIYSSGGNIHDAISSPMFRKIRDWQEQHGYDKPVDETRNWLCPCMIRDHFDEFAEIVTSCGGKPINEEARQAIEDPAYCAGMVDYGKRMHELTDPIWDEEYSKALGDRLREQRSETQERHGLSVG